MRNKCAAILALCLISVPLTACGNPASNNGAGKAPISNRTVAPDDNADAPENSSEGNSSEGNAPKGKNPATRESAERYRDCLEKKGVGAEIMDDNIVVFKFEGDEGSVGSSSMNSSDRQQAIEECKSEVPDYHEPDYNTK
jgi:predicted small secreted protein